ncbi:kinesin-domain-containing protein [Dendrothele bispora CBS 962.96]|uniref:Kinesin-like protein n=1 Tax=Dendrothele bispora (strain CBS 962.96) TaxID=1314807 RepID=A0A4S8M6J2_DENBC|nr:kinesin-domain-containing protein [Dendrothele bispora CBS 962.96]
MSQKIRIAARLRPRLEGEVDDGGIQVCHAVDQSGSSSSSAANTSGAGNISGFSGRSYISVQNPRVPGQLFNFPFSSCYDQNSSQEEIFVNDVQPMIDIVYSGVTVTIFAYGVTSSGKTHTMQGTKAEPGVIPRAVRSLFLKKAEYAQYQVTLSASYMEIYKDEAYDLLVNRESAPKLPVRENDAGLVFVANLSSIPIDSVEQFDRIYAQATKNRSVGATNLNRASSRSHAVLTIEVAMVDVRQHMTRTGKINLVDLAGSENNKHTGNDSVRMAESAAINKSLTALGQVVHALNKGHSRIPYRDSKLTRILQDALGGSSVGLLICNIAPGTKFRQDTLNTLNFASRTKNIANKPVVNERDNRPVPKPHFAALNVPQQPISTKPFQPLPTNLVQPTAANSENIMPLAVDVCQPQPLPKSRKERRSGRPSMVPVPQPRSSRPSSAAFPTGSFNFQSIYQPFGGTMASGSASASSSAGPSGAATSGLSEKEIDERISKAVEMEVARRLEEREKERLRELEEERRLSVGQEALASTSASQPRSAKNSPARLVSGSVSRSGSTSAHGTPSRSGSKRRVPSKSPRRDTIAKERDEIQPAQAIPPGILTPLLKRHKDLDEQLSLRLHELERKYEQGNKEAQLASVLSPVSKKKTGKAYVSLARAHSEKGDLQVALDLYRKAESYVPENIKLKERWILFVVHVFLNAVSHHGVVS